MKSILFCTSYIADKTNWQQRYSPWFNHYTNIDLGASHIIAIDDAASYSTQQREIGCINTKQLITQSSDPRLIVRFDDRLGRASLLDYPGWWRSFFHSLNVARQVNAQKIIHIESDAFLLSQRIAGYIREIDSGWTTLWSNHFKIPETAIQVICKDQFDNLERFSKQPPENLKGHFAEKILPFTAINKSFIGDRYGDIRKNRGIFRSRKFNSIPFFNRDFFWARIPADADFATQVTERLWCNSPILSSQHFRAEAKSTTCPTDSN